MTTDTPVKKLLILAANPKGTSPLRLDEEVREIEAGLQRAQKRDQFILEQKWAVRPRDIQRAMLDINPQIVHFSGHGAGDEAFRIVAQGIRKAIAQLTATPPDIKLRSEALFDRTDTGTRGHGDTETWI